MTTRTPKTPSTSKVQRTSDARARTGDRSAERTGQASQAQTYRFTKALKRRAILEGWYIFQTGRPELEVQRIDTQDHPKGRQLETDDEAIKLAKAAGVPCDEYGVIPFDVEGI